MAGLAAAKELRHAGWNLTVLDKGRVVGGRMATLGFDDGRVDYGAQFFTLRDEAFAELARPWVAAGMALPWTERRYRVAAGMRSIPEAMAEGLDVRLATKVAGVSEAPEGWAVETEAGERFASGHLLLTAPVPQSVEMLTAGALELKEMDGALLERARYWKCLTLLARIEGGARLGPSGFVAPEDGNLAWIADNHAKGVSPLRGCLTIHATREFSEAKWESPPSEVVQQMLTAAAAFYMSRVRSYYLHRWRYAEPAMQMPALFHGIGTLAFAGDVFGGPHVGGAAASGLAAAAYLLRA